MIGADDRAALNTVAGILDQLPDVLRAERRRRGLSQEKAAKQIGVDRQAVNGWENSRVHPQWRHVPALVRWLAAP